MPASSQTHDENQVVFKFIDTKTALDVYGMNESDIVEVPSPGARCPDTFFYYPHFGVYIRIFIKNME